jgi:hypothetical protein
MTYNQPSYTFVFVFVQLNPVKKKILNLIQRFGLMFLPDADGKQARLTNDRKDWRPRSVCWSVRDRHVGRGENPVEAGGKRPSTDLGFYARIVECVPHPGPLVAFTEFDFSTRQFPNLDN